MKHRLLLAAAMLAVALDPAPSANAQATPVELRILAINDFHGYLRPPQGGIRITDPADKSKKIAVPAGGSEQMATLVKELRQGAKNNIFVAAGDLIGASPFLSAMFHDEPTIESLSMMGLEVASVGNHEFDEGKDELLRIQNGGCRPTDARGRTRSSAQSFAISPPLPSRRTPARPSFRPTRSGSSTASRSPSSALH
jgi:5'-nucleotidase